MVHSGLEVRVFDENGRQHGQPEQGWPGHVQTVGTRLALIQYGGVTKKFRLDTRRANDLHATTWFETLDQVDFSLRKQAAKNTLGQHGLRLDHGMFLEMTADKLEELAAAVRQVFEGAES